MDIRTRTRRRSARPNEKQSKDIIADNATKTPAALAANYQAAHAQYGWSRHGDVPAAVKDALRHPGRV